MYMNIYIYIYIYNPVSYINTLISVSDCLTTGPIEIELNIEP